MKFKVDMTKGLYNQTWWNLLKPEVKLKAIQHWKDTIKLLEPKEVGVDGYEYNDDILLDYKPIKTKEEKTL
jgi:hypothetical protein|tara:strand:+ start:1179 stop:1391 length:213 start_codon:yes stop_codon:yes gene_type:complete